MHACSLFVQRTIACLALCFGVSTLALAQAPAAPSSAGAAQLPALKIEPLMSPAAMGSSEPQMTVQDTRVILSWLEVAGENATLKFSEWMPKAATGWSDAKTVHASKDFFVNSFDVPSVRALMDGSLAAHWMETNGENEDASKIRLSTSKDGGSTWSLPTSPHHDGTMTEHGFVSLFQAPGQGLGVVWIDGRLTDPKTEAGDMSLRTSIFDVRGKELVSEAVVNPRVCECCSTSAAPTSEGVIVAYRGRSADEIRDIFVSRLVGGHWAPPVDVHHDGWKLEACPINGPAISAMGNEVAVAWFMAKNNLGQAFVAFSRDAGKSFDAPIRVDDAGSLGRLGVALLEDGSAAVTWIEQARPRPQLRVRMVTPNGARSAPAVISDAAGGERYPRIVRAGNELLLAWTEGSEKAPQVKTARATIPASPK